MFPLRSFKEPERKHIMRMVRMIVRRVIPHQLIMSRHSAFTLVGGFQIGLICALHLHNPSRCVCGGRGVCVWAGWGNGGNNVGSAVTCVAISCLSSSSLYVLNTIAARFAVLKAACWCTPNALRQTRKYVAAFAKIIAKSANLVKASVVLCLSSAKRHFGCMHV